MARKATTDTIDLQSLPLVDEPDSRQFILRVGEYRARMEYERDGDRIFLGTLDVPRPVVEMGVGDVVMEKTLMWVEENRLKLIPTAPAIKAYLRKNASWQRLLLKGVQL
ncbi:MAG: N-acetyltransferase [Flavobacteriales bacterium]|nr:N-acetyltransferase [Flavobacteriales bacterium]